MTLEHYLFTLFIFFLLCLLVFLCSLLFSDAKKQKRLLDEKEAKLLRLYAELEVTMEDFGDTMELTKAEWESQRKVLHNLVAQTKEAGDVSPRPSFAAHRRNAESAASTVQTEVVQTATAMDDGSTFIPLFETVL